MGYGCLSGIFGIIKRHTWQNIFVRPTTETDNVYDDDTPVMTTDWRRSGRRGVGWWRRWQRWEKLLWWQQKNKNKYCADTLSTVSSSPPLPVNRVEELVSLSNREKDIVQDIAKVLGDISATTEVISDKDGDLLSKVLKIMLNHPHHELIQQNGISVVYTLKLQSHTQPSFFPELKPADMTAFSTVMATLMKNYPKNVTILTFGSIILLDVSEQHLRLCIEVANFLLSFFEENALETSHQEPALTQIVDFTNMLFFKDPTVKAAIVNKGNDNAKLIETLLKTISVRTIQGRKRRKRRKRRRRKKKEEEEEEEEEEDEEREKIRPTHVSFLTGSWDLLFKLIDGHPVNPLRFFDSDGIDCVLSTYESFPTDDENLNNSAMRVLRSSFNGINKKTFEPDTKESLIASLQKMINTHPPLKPETRENARSILHTLEYL